MIIIMIGAATVLIPAAGFLLGWLLSVIIPGCHCDEGAGCGGCGGAGGLVAFLLYGGFVGALATLVTVFPASLILAAIVGLFSKRR